MGKRRPEEKGAALEELGWVQPAARTAGPQTLDQRTFVEPAHVIPELLA
jgi:hypothetical protein